ncbi:uncharacterized protein LOC106450666 [Brassica napus]|uniref:uncharacterized protein LOC106450666 n=1 Tax=Brassica napus TaxID=3708 RepID=UPI0020798EC9|nr:uncharacterized protein LOC106450666 [Brassica napus]
MAASDGGSSLPVEVFIQSLTDKASELLGLKKFDEAIVCLRIARELSEYHLGDVAILSVSMKLLSCLVEKVSLETQKDGIKNMIEEGMIIFNQMKILAGKADYDSVAKVYCDLGDSALKKGEVDLALKIYSGALFFVDSVADLLSSLVYTKHQAIMNFAMASCLEQAKKHGEALRHCEISVLKSGALLNMKETAKDRKIKLLHLRGLEKMEVLKYADEIPLPKEHVVVDPPQPSATFLAKKRALEAALRR